jgi:phosphate transport system permease protein
MSSHGEHYERQLYWRHRIGQVFEWLCRLATMAALAILVVLLGSIVITAFRPGRGKGPAPVTITSMNPNEKNALGLTYRVSNISGGQFEWKDKPDSKLTRFSAADVVAGKVVFNHDGRRVSPVYDLSIDSGVDAENPPITFKKIGPGNMPTEAVIPYIDPPKPAKPWGWLTWGFLTKGNSYDPLEAGIMVGFWGSIWLIGLTALMAVPMGVGAAVYLEEYAKPTALTKFIQLNIANLAGVPSIVYGILGFTVFNRMFGVFDKNPTQLGLMIPGMNEISITLPFGPVVFSGACTLALLSLPVVIITSQEALRSIPASLRHAAYALGATKWQTIWHQVLPAALPGILTGVILSLSRAIGEAAPLAVVGVAAQLSYAPGEIQGIGDLVQHPDKLIRAPFSRYTALPTQVYSWVNEAVPNFEHVAAAGILVLLATLLTMNGLAIFIRHRYQSKNQW